MKILLRRDYQGDETGNVFYAAGTPLDLRTDYAERLVDFGFATKVKDEPAAAPSKPVTAEAGAQPATAAAPAQPKRTTKRKKAK